MLGLLSPGARQIQDAVQESMAAGRGIGEEYSNLAVLNPPGDA
jgi:hypothetical protein